MRLYRNIEARELPLLAAGTLNSMRRLIAEDLDAQPCCRIPMAAGVSTEEPCQKEPKTSDPSEIISGGLSKSAKNARASAQLMRTRYCIRYELGLLQVEAWWFWCSGPVNADGEASLTFV